jgi:hypothetical protein
MIDWRGHPEWIAFLVEFIPGHTEKQIADAFYEKFGVLVNRMQIKNFKTHYKVKSGTIGGQFQKGHKTWNKGRKMDPEVYKKCAPTMFKKGKVSVNKKPVGSERVNVDGYVEIKVAEPNKWMLKQRYVYEQHHHIKLTSNDAIIFLDGNRLNNNIDNLFRMTRSALARFNQDGLYCDNPEISKAAAQMAMLKTEISKRKE